MRAISFFFFQAEDGIRDYKVTGVQTCALPIYRRDPRLGTRPLPARRLGARHLRRGPPLRARRPAPRLASRLAHARLQPRADRGAELPPRKRALLAPGAPRRRAPCRRRCLDALPRLLAPG